MTSGQKIAFSLLTSIVLSAGFVLVSHSKLIPELETKYYAKSKIEEKTTQINKIAESCDAYISNVLNEIQGKDDSYLKSKAVSSYVAQNPSEKDVIERRELTEALFRKLPALEGIRLVDKNGRNVHFSTYDSTDIFRQSGISKQYKNYPDIIRDADEIPFEQIKLNEQSPELKLLLDSTKNRILLSLPFYWMDNVYAGSMIFYLNVPDMENVLVEEGVISLGSSFNMITDSVAMKGGFATGVPAKTKNEFFQPILNSWKLPVANKGEFIAPERILQIDDNLYWVMLTATSKYFKISGVYTSDIFELSTEIIYLIYGCGFLTILLIVYLFFSIQSDSMVTLKKRIKKIQYSIVKEYLNNKDDVEWSKVVSQLKTRKQDLTTDILKSLNVHSKKKRKELDEILEKNWDEIFALTGKSESPAAAETAGTVPAVQTAGSGVTLDEIRRMLEEVLKTTKVNVQAAPVKKSKPVVAAPVEEVEEIDEVDEIEEIDDVEEVEEIDEVEEIEEAEEVDEVEEIDEVEEAEEIDEVEEVDEIEETEEIDEAEEVEEIDEAEEIDEVEEVEEIDEAEEVDEVEEIDEVEEVDEVEEIDEVEEVDEVEEIDEVEEVDEVEEAEEIEEVEEIDDVEEADDVEEIEEAEELEEIPAPKMDFTPPPSPPYEYTESTDTYIPGDLFPTTENLFGEELGLGEKSSPNWIQTEGEYSFVIYNFDGFPEGYEKPVEEGEAGEFVSEEVEAGEVVSEDVEACEFVSESVESVPEEVESVSESVESVSEEVESVSEDVDELTEELPEPDVKPYFSMTGFANNITEVEALEGTVPETIVENEGVYSIADNLEYTDVIQDQDFKSLVDSVL